MAKFNVGDLVDVRLDEGLTVGCTVTSLWDGGMWVKTPSGKSWSVDDDNCIPHVPAPVVQPAPVDPLTGLTAQESERRYSARLSAFGRGEADPFAVLFDPEATPPGASKRLVRSKPLQFTRQRWAEEDAAPRPLTIEDVKVGSRWVSTGRDKGAVVVADIVGGYVTIDDGEDPPYALHSSKFLSWFKPAPEAAPAPRTFTAEEIKAGKHLVGWILP